VVGRLVGEKVAPRPVGVCVVGVVVGAAVGVVVGAVDGALLGEEEGLLVGVSDGDSEGAGDGDKVTPVGGEAEGEAEGEAVGVLVMVKLRRRETAWLPMKVPFLWTGPEEIQGAVSTRAMLTGVMLVRNFVGRPSTFCMISTCCVISIIAVSTTKSNSLCFSMSGRIRFCSQFGCEFKFTWSLASTSAIFKTTIASGGTLATVAVTDTYESL